jgi:hypothetical protein
MSICEKNWGGIGPGDRTTLLVDRKKGMPAGERSGEHAKTQTDGDTHDAPAMAAARLMWMTTSLVVRMPLMT